MIVWTEQATLQLDRAHDYIALSNSEEVAARITMHILASVQLLASFPMSGRRGRVPGTRELVISNTPFIAAYTIDHDRIVILAIYHVANYTPDLLWLEQLPDHSAALDGTAAHQDRPDARMVFAA